MKRKEDLTRTNKQMLVAQLRKEQEQNRILRIELEKAKRDKNFAERDASATICMFNDESRKVQSHINRYKAKIEDLKDEIIYLERKIAIRDNALKDRDKAIEMLEGKQDTIVKQAKIDVLNELKEKCKFDGHTVAVYKNDIDELIKEVQNEN